MQYAGRNFQITTLQFFKTLLVELAEPAHHLFGMEKAATYNSKTISQKTTTQ